MKEIYHYVGMVATWAIIVAAIVFILYWIVVISQMVIIWSKHTNWYKYHIDKMDIKTDNLRKAYSTPRIAESRNNKKYILLFRFRNINACKNNLPRFTAPIPNKQ